MFDSPYLGTLTSELENFVAVHRTFCVHQMCEKSQQSIRRKFVVFEVKVPGKIKIAEIFLRGTMFDSPYLRRQSRYSRYFTAIDSTPIRLQGDQKSLVYGWKCPHYRRSNLGITRYTTLVVRGTMFESLYLGTLTSELQNLAAVHRTFCVHQMCEK